MSGKACTAFILVNDAMPGFARFETTTKDDVVSRVKAMNRTELPVPFRLFYAANVIDCDVLARSIRFLFADHCDGGVSTFFKMAPEILRAAIEPAAIAVLEYSDEELGISPVKQAQMRKIREYHDLLRFKAVDVYPGEVLYFSKQPTVTCIAIGNGFVEFEGSVMTPVEAALRVIGRLGFDWNEITATDYWLPLSARQGANDGLDAGASIIDPAFAAKNSMPDAVEASPIMFVRNNKI